MRGDRGSHEPPDVVVEPLLEPVPLLTLPDDQVPVGVPEVEAVPAVALLAPGAGDTAD